MPTLGQVITRDMDERVFRESAAFALRDDRVVAIRLGTGAPCAGHADLFESWPGPECHVVRWFQLESGHAVGIAAPPAGAQQVHVWKMATDHT